MSRPQNLSGRAARGAAWLALSSALLAGCASVATDSALGPIADATEARLGVRVQANRDDDSQAAIDDRVAALLQQPLTAEAAVEIALINQRGLQAQMAALAVTDAERAQAGRLPNPGFSFARTRRGDEREIERGLHIDLARLLLMPQIADLETRRLDRERQQLLQRVLSLAADARKAWIEAVAAEEALRYMARVRRAADASAELARRMRAVGNFSPLQQAREEAFQADALLAVARAEQQQRRARERLIRRLGLWGAQTGFALPEQLPPLPERIDERPSIEQEAMATRLDVQAASLAAEHTAANLGLTRVTRFVNVLELGVLHNSSNVEPTQTGWEIGLELPLFDWGGARVARAEAVYLEALHRAAETAINARSEVREAYGQWRSSYDIARHHRDQIVPLRKRIAEENVLRYNGMLIGVFELLADARVQILSVAAALDAQRDFWLAQADLDAALIGPAPLMDNAAAGPAAAAAAADGGGH